MEAVVYNWSRWGYFWIWSLGCTWCEFLLSHLLFLVPDGDCGLL